MRIRISDVNDFVITSQFAIDILSVCESSTGKADLNCDCIVDIKDFAVLANDWTNNCTDLYGDCLLGTDINDDKIVDVCDLSILAEYWGRGNKNLHLRSDIYDDNIIDFKDFSVFAGLFDANLPLTDFNADGCTDYYDLDVLFETWRTTLY